MTTQASCLYSVPAVGQSLSNLETILAGVPIDLALPKLWGVVPTSDTTTGSVGPPTVATRTIVLAFGTTFSSSAGGIFTLDGGEKASPIRKITLPGGIPSNYGAPPIVAIPDATGKGATAFVECGVGTIFVLNGGTGYTGATVASLVGGDLAPGGTPAALGAPSIVAGNITAVPVVTVGKGYNVFMQVKFTDSGGGSGAIAFAALQPVDCLIQQQGQGYTAPALGLIPFFKSCCPDSSDQTEPFQNWMTQILAQGSQSNVSAAAPVVS